MIGHFFMKYRFPLAYAATKVMANIIHDRIVRRPVRAHRACEIRSLVVPLPRQTVRAIPPTSTASYREYPEKEETVVVKPRAVEVPKQVIPTQSWTHQPRRPAATKSNGGLRGSTATKWR